MLKENDPSLKSWIEIPDNSDFPIQNLPFGVFSVGSEAPRPGVALGDYVIDLKALADLGYFEGLGFSTKQVFSQATLNSFLDQGKANWRATRARISELFREDNNRLKDNYDERQKVLKHRSEVTMHLPIAVGDYTDFYSSIEHATNVGSMFRPDNPLMPNWKHLPVGYHGRASSIVVSGTPIHRPKGQMKPKDAEVPTFGECKLLDFELEMGFVIGGKTNLGQRVPVSKAEDYIFGIILFNDWSARDIQAWEYQPLGPFLAKNFASTVSPWIVTLDALEPFKTLGPVQDPEPLPYLRSTGERNYDINLEVHLKTPQSEKRICESNTKYLYWDIRQQLAHHTVTGCNLNSGDMCASGTISGPNEENYGSMLELTWRGSKPLTMPGGEERKFIEDGDTVTLKAFAKKDGIKIGFGDCTGKILPATPLED